MIYKIFLILILFLSAAFAQNDVPYYLTAEAGAGYSHYFTDIDAPDLNQGGFNGSFRIMWHPEYLLSLGLETGYSTLYSLDYSGNAGSAKISMTSVPIMGVFSMKIFPVMFPEFELKVATGVLLLTNNAEGFGENISSSLVSIGYSAAATYLVPLNDIISLGGEVKYQSISKLQDADLAVQLIFSYRFLDY